MSLAGKLPDFRSRFYRAILTESVSHTHSGVWYRCNKTQVAKLFMSHAIYWVSLLACYANENWPNVPQITFEPWDPSNPGRIYLPQNFASHVHAKRDLSEPADMLLCRTRIAEIRTLLDTGRAEVIVWTDGSSLRTDTKTEGLEYCVVCRNTTSSSA